MTNIAMFMLAVQVFGAAALAWSCFCRLVRTDDTTAREIRMVIWFEGVTAGMVLGAPFLPMMVPEIQWRALTTPLWVWLLLLAGAAGVQIVTARYWRAGVPPDFVDTGRSARATSWTREQLLGKNRKERAWRW